MKFQCDTIVIGSGIAGLTFALKAAEQGEVIILCKTHRREGATGWAQGGIAAVFSKQDSFESHIKDTLTAGDGLCHPDIVKIAVEEGPAEVQKLISLGVAFSKNEKQDTNFAYDLTKEGGHSERRILHAEDFTGKAILETLIQACEQNSRIRFFEYHVAIDLITDDKVKKKKTTGRKKCLGVYALDSKNSDSKNSNQTSAGNQIHTFSAPVTVLATGGAGKIYLYTSNPDVATGDGIAMAYRAGARVANLEFMQFHPTSLFHPRAKSFLISEALRGEGGELIDADGREFMKKVHPSGSLAPRDIVARAIDAEIKRTGVDCVYLDMTRVVKKHGKDSVRERFPNIYEKCLEFGIDLIHQPIPVVPAAHYFCGGVLTDMHGESSVENLFALGEVACTGLHGSNRLASNSLLEGVVFAERAYKRIKEKKDGGYLKTPQYKSTPEPLPEWDHGHAVPMEEHIDIKHSWKEIRTLMWNYVGIVRSDRRLSRALERLKLIQHEVDEYYWHYLLDRDLIELRNLVQVSYLTVQSALLRKESRGLHYNLDYPFKDELFFKRDTVL